MNDRVLAQTATGQVSGFTDGQQICFLGIPYAKADRFKAPEPVCWDGVLDASSFGKKAMQVVRTDMPWSKPQPREDFDENCQNINIFIPSDIQEGEHLPVLFEVHGGGFQDGSNRGPELKNRGKDHRIIFAAINYRLGALGFLPMGELLGRDYAGSGNCGLLDQMAALRWVHENIAAFGGDPEKITVTGASAGAKSIGALMLLPEFDRYAAQVLLSSGATQSVRSLATQQENSRRFAAFAKDYMAEQGRSFAPADLLTMTSDEIIEVQRRFTDNPGNTCMFGPVADGIIIPEDWQETAAAGTNFNGPAMIGCSRHEMGLFKRFEKDFLAKAPLMADALFGEINGSIARGVYDRLTLEAAEAGQKPDQKMQEDLWVRVLTDYMYRMYSYRLARRLAAKPSCTVWQYSMELLPAFHCSDQTVAYALPEKPDNFLYNTDEILEKTRPVGRRVFESFMEFVETGKVSSWAPLDPARPAQMYFDVVSEEREIPEDDVLEGFPEAVYRLV